MKGLESGEKTREPVHESERTGKELREALDSEKKWAEFVEKVKKQDELEAEIRRWGEELDRQERTQGRVEQVSKRAPLPVEAGSVTERGESTGAARDEVQERTNIRFKGDLDRAIEHHPGVRLKQNFERDYGNAVERVERGRAGRDEGEKLIGELDRLEIYRLYTEAHGGAPDAHIDSMECVRNALQKHPDIEMTEAQANVCEKYFIVVHDDSKIHAELSKDLGVSMGQVANWKCGESPQPIGELRKREADRILDEWVRATDFQKITEHEPTRMKLEQRFDAACEIPQSVVRESVPLETKQPWTRDDLAELTRRVYENLPESSARVHYTDLGKSAGLPAKELAELERAVSVDHAGFEKMVQEKVRLDGVDASVRVGFVDGVLYTWNPNLNPRDLINPYGSLFFYFRDRDTLARFISEVKGRIQDDAGGGLHDTTQHLERLIAQMFPERREGPSVNNASARIQGEHLHLMLDMLGTTIKSLEGDISRLTKGGGRGGIDNPRFPEGKTFEVLVNRLMSTVTSDCHLRPSGTVEYFEDKADRIRIVTEYLQAFGDIDMKAQWVAHEHHFHAYMRAPIGKMLHYLGITATNKCVENQGLPDIVFEFCWEARCAYIEDLIPQDGSVSGGRIWWCHSVALNPGSKDEKYGIAPKVNQDLVEFVWENSEEGNKGRVLAYGKLEGKTISDNPVVSEKARQLKRIVGENKCNLVEDEVRICGTLGIKMESVPASIHYLPKTGRLTVSWTARPVNHMENVKLGMTAPPNDVEKRSRVRDMLRRNAAEVEKAIQEFASRGVDIERWWE